MLLVMVSESFNLVGRMQYFWVSGEVNKPSW